MLWLDSDALIARFDIPLLIYFKHLLGKKDAVFSTEFDQPLNLSDADIAKVQSRKPIRTNTGVIFLRRTKWTHAFLDKIYSHTPVNSRGMMLHEQHEINGYIKNHHDEWQKHVIMVHYRFINGWYKTFQQDALIFHTAGGVFLEAKYDTIVLPKCLEFNKGARGFLNNSFLSLQGRNQAWPFKKPMGCILAWVLLLTALVK